MREANRWRWLGALPLLFYGLTVRDYALRGELANSLWVCHVSDLVLGIGALAGLSTWVWVAGLWTLMGTAGWVWDLAMNPRFSSLAMASHFGGIAVALAMMRAHPKPRRLLPYGLAYLAGIQLVCRFTTPEALNVNASHSVYKDLVRYFPAYWMYWLANALLFGALILILERVLGRWLAPPRAVPARE